MPCDCLSQIGLEAHKSSLVNEIIFRLSNPRLRLALSAIRLAVRSFLQCGLCPAVLMHQSTKDSGITSKGISERICAQIWLSGWIRK